MACAISTASALNITKLPKAEHDAEEWQAAMKALLLAAIRRALLAFNNRLLSLPETIVKTVTQAKKMRAL